MNGMKKRFAKCCAVLLMSTFAVLFGATAHGEDVGQELEWEKATDIPEKEYRLAGDGNGKLLPGVEFHEISGKLSHSLNVDLERGQSLTLTAWSENFQPVIMILGAPVEEGTSALTRMRFAGREILRKSVHDEPKPIEGRPFHYNHVTRFEFLVPNEGGLFTITVSGEVADDGFGAYFMKGEIWDTPETEAVEAEVEAEDNVEVAGDGTGVAELAKYRERGSEEAGPQVHTWARRWDEVKEGVPISVGDVTITWLEPGDGSKSLPKAKPDPRHVLKSEGNVYYLKPGPRFQKVILVDANRELGAVVTVFNDYKHLLPSLVFLARTKLEEHQAAARRRPVGE